MIKYIMRFLTSFGMTTRKVWVQGAAAAKPPQHLTLTKKRPSFRRSEATEKSLISCLFFIPI